MTTQHTSQTLDNKTVAELVVIHNLILGVNPVFFFPSSVYAKREIFSAQRKNEIGNS